MMTTILIIGGVIAGVLLVVGIIITVREEQTVLDDRFSHYVEEEFEDAVALAEEQKTSAFSEWLDRQLEGSKFGDKIATNLAQADLKLRPAEYVAAMVIAAFLLGFFAWAIGGQNIVSAMIGAVVGAMAPRIYMRRQQSKRLVTFGNQLPDMLNLVVNGLRAGYSTMQALEAVSKELPAPLSVEFARVVKEMQLGIGMEESMDNLHRRIPSEDLDLIITAINVQREVGGNLAEILDTISYTIRERIKINGKEISKQYVISFIKKNKPFFEESSLSFFEMTVGMAFDYFAKKKVDIAIIEVGLGGRLDSTNIITPEVSVITNIGIDHTQFLGNTLEEIAVEKGGIIKEAVPVIIGETQKETKPVFETIAKQRNAELFFADQLVNKVYKSDLKGTYQEKNIRTVIQTIIELQRQGYNWILYVATNRISI